MQLWSQEAYFCTNIILIVEKCGRNAPWCRTGGDVPVYRAADGRVTADALPRGPESCDPDTFLAIVSTSPLCGRRLDNVRLCEMFDCARFSCVTCGSWRDHVQIHLVGRFYDLGPDLG